MTAEEIIQMRADFSRMKMKIDAHAAAVEKTEDGLFWGQFRSCSTHLSDLISRAQYELCRDEEDRMAEAIRR